MPLIPFARRRGGSTARRLACALACAAPFAPVFAAAATPWPELPQLPRAHVEWALLDAVVNGLPTRAQRFDTELSVAEVLGFYRAHWAAYPAGPPVGKRVADWDTLSTAFGPFQIAVQAKPHAPRGTEGLVSVIDLGAARTDWQPRDWPRWNDTAIVNVTETADGPRHSQFVSEISRASFDVAVQRWREAWTQRGYHLAREQRPALPGDAHGWLALFDKPGGTLDVTIEAVGGTVSIHANRMSLVDGDGR